MKHDPRLPLNVTLRWREAEDTRVGRLAYRDGQAYLEFDEAFIRSGIQLSPLHHRAEPGLQPPKDRHVFEGLHGYLNDSLPDGWGRLLLDRRARQLGIDPASLTPLDRLACVGSSGMGALCYAPAVDPWDGADRELDLARLAANAREVLDGAVPELLTTLGKAGGSPGGARPKALIALNNEGHALHGSADIPEGYEPFLVKFPGQDDPEDIARIEMAYAEMARAAGIQMPETRLLTDEQGRSHFAVRRFDRLNGERRHVHSAAGMLYADYRVPSLDYDGLIKLTRFVTRDHRDCAAMYRLALFNVLAHNRDDHGKQFGFILDRGGVWRLAPAYDLTPSSGPGGEHSTSILGQGKDVSTANLIALGGRADLRPAEATAILEAVRDAVDQWDELARAHDVSRASITDVSARIARARPT